MLQLTSTEIVFDWNNPQPFTLTLSSPTLLAFKIKSTNPSIFQVRPSKGIIQKQLKVDFHPNFQQLSDPNVVVNQKFLIQAVPLQSQLTFDEIDQLWKNPSQQAKVEQIKLSISLIKDGSKVQSERLVQSVYAGIKNDSFKSMVKPSAEVYDKDLQLSQRLNEMKVEREELFNRLHELKQKKSFVRVHAGAGHSLGNHRGKHYFIIVFFCLNLKILKIKMQAYFPQTFGSHQKDQFFTPEVRSILPLDVITDYYRQEESPDEHHQSLMIQQHPAQHSFQIQYDPKYQRASIRESPFKRKLQHEIHEINQSILQEQQEINKENMIPRAKPKVYSKQQQVQILDYDTKYKLINWLYSIDLLKSTNQLVDKLPKLAKSGVFFCDLLNRLHGRIDPLIKGILRKPKGRQMKHNWLKVFDQLKQNQRMNSRYLFCENILSSEHDHPQYEDIVWGLLQDIFTAFTGRKTPRRQSNPVNPMVRTKSQMNTEVTLTTQQNEFSPIKKSPSPMKQHSPVRPSPVATGRYSSIHVGRKASNAFAPSKSPVEAFPPSKSPVEAKTSQTVTQRQVRQTTKCSQQSTQLGLVTLGPVQVVKISQTDELDLKRWLEMNNLSTYLQRKNPTLFEDATRNGVIVSKLLIQLGMIRGSTKLHHNPKQEIVDLLPTRNILDCQENWQKALCVFELGAAGERIMEKLMSGCRNHFFSLISTIKKFQDRILEDNKLQQDSLKLRESHKADKKKK